MCVLLIGNYSQGTYQLILVKEFILKVGYKPTYTLAFYHSLDISDTTSFSNSYTICLNRYHNY